MTANQSKKHDLNIEIGPVKIQTKNVSNKILLLIAATVFVLGLGIAYSFIKGWSTLTLATERAEKAAATVKEREKEMIIRSALDAEKYEENND